MPSTAAAAAATVATSSAICLCAVKEAKVCNAGVLGLGREAMAIIGNLQGADVHAVELHVCLALEGYLLLHWHFKLLDLGVSRAFHVELDELGGDW